MEFLIHDAVKSKDLALCQKLISNKANLHQRDSSGEVPLSLAISLGCREIVEELLTAGADPDIGGWASPLELAVRREDIEIVKLLISAGADVNITVDGFTPLMAAVCCDNLYLTKFLVEVGADPSILRDGHCSALSLAADKSSREIYDYLLSVTS